jgi:serpin B
MPRFAIRSEFELTETLSWMGMPLAFNSRTDFSGMTGFGDLFIGAVVHDSFVSVDEAGTEAVAATAVVMRKGESPGEQVEALLDRPFVFLVRDIRTGTSVFLGRVTDPRA